MTFSIDRHDRLKKGADPEASEFDQFADLIHSELWTTVDAAGDSSGVEEAPVFVEDEITWTLSRASE